MSHERWKHDSEGKEAVNGPIAPIGCGSLPLPCDVVLFPTGIIAIETQRHDGRGRWLVSRCIFGKDCLVPRSSKEEGCVMNSLVFSAGSSGLGASLSILIFVLLAAEIGLPAQRSRASDDLRLACSSDAPVVTEGASIAVRVWALSTSSALRYAWTADAGNIGSSGREVQWDFKDVTWSPNPHQAIVKVTLQSGTTASCSVQVTVLTEQRGGRVPTRSFLVKGQKEGRGYGLYSYFLLGSRPIGSARERYLATMKAYLAGMEDVSQQNDLPAGTLNVTYLPIETTAPPNFTLEWLLDHYDFARAKALLHALPGDLTDGPYIVSTLKPLDSSTTPDRYLFQDLSRVPLEPSELISWWVREFLHQSAQERFWEPKTAELLALKLRTTIAVLAVGLPEVQKAIASWVAWRH